MSDATKTGVLYCHCQYAQVIDPAVKEAVLRRLAESDVSFEAVADLCEMSARKDPALRRLAACESVKVAACFPRAVKWLFASAGAPLPKDATEILNMREQSADEVAERLFADDLRSNLPADQNVPRANEAPSKS